MARRVGLVGAVVLATALGCMAAFRHYLKVPVGRPGSAVVDVGRGASLRHALEQAAAHGKLRHPTLLYLYARLRGRTRVGAGRYALSGAVAPRDLLATLNEGRVLMEDVTLAEGLNRWQVRDILARAGWIEPHIFDRLCDDRDFLRGQKVAGPTCEGYLYPETYRFVRGTGAEAILAAMFTAFRRHYREVTHAHGQGPLALGERDFVSLAAIVEKETAQPSERPRIACVFYNRLRARPAWRLQTDPTVIYAARLQEGGQEGHFDGNLTRRHLHQLDSPYNTYRVEGLPPGPIANPGRQALEAVAQPSLCKDYFFVSNNKGEHIFCPTLKCHAQAVDQYQVDYFRKKRSLSPLPGRRRHHAPRHKDGDT